MTSTLTDRYIWAVQRSLPEAQRADIDRELRATIADTIDGRRENGADETTAERETIIELGNPYRLASGYADRPLYLIGPAVFPDYIQLLKLLYTLVLPIVFAAILLAQLLGKPESIGGAIGTAIGVIISVAVHFGFWTTLVFALIDRSPQYKPQAWNPDTLPAIPVRGTIRLSDLIASAAWFAFLIGGLIWAQYISLFRNDAGEVIPVFDPALGAWVFYYLTLAVVELVFRILLYRVRAWNYGLAVVNLVRDLAFVIPTLWLLLSGQLMNPQFIDRANIAPLFESDGVVTIVSVIVILVAATGSVIDGFVKASRAGRAPAA